MPQALLAVALFVFCPSRCALAVRSGGIPRGVSRLAPAYDAAQVPLDDVFDGSWVSRRSSPFAERTPALHPVIFLEGATRFYDRAHAAAGVKSKVNGTASDAVNTWRGKPPLTSQSWLALLRLTLSFTLVVKCLCIMSNVVFQASPFPLVRQMVQNKNTGEADSAPFIGICFCAIQNSFYGLFAYIVLQKSGFLVLMYSNVVGVSFGSYYVLSFVRNCDSEKGLRVTFNYLKAAAMIWGVQGAVIMSIPHFRALLFVGFTSSCCSLVSAASLVTTVPEVLRTRCSRVLPVPVLISGALSYCLWSICGFTLWDPYIMLPNVVGLSFCLFAISLAFRFPADPPAKSQPADYPAKSQYPRKHGAGMVEEAVTPTTIGPETTGESLAEEARAEWGGGTGGT